MQTCDNDFREKHVFVCGLQRSGTSVLARNLGKLDDCTSFKQTGVLEDEGQYLQDVFLTDHRYGGVGWYGFDPRAHLTEHSELLTQDNIARLKASWDSHWDPTKPIRLEKTPGNLIMTRFLQAAFPDAYFIVIKRHPVPASMASQKWSMSPLHRLFEHWLQCYDIFESDKRHLNRVYELTYEGYIQDASRYHREIADFIGTRPPAVEMEQVTAAHNEKYFNRWSELLTSSRFSSYYRFIATRYEPGFSRHGYSLLNSSDGSYTREAVATPLMEPRAANGFLGWSCCTGANFMFFVLRFHKKYMHSMTRGLRACLSDSAKQRIKNVLQTGHLHWLARFIAPRWFYEELRDKSLWKQSRLKMR
jgi:hypothetical protein